MVKIFKSKSAKFKKKRKKKITAKLCMILNTSGILKSEHEKRT